MQRFVFIGEQGAFAVPGGESRMGSDAACQICIRGDGVLPVHAYLRADSEKLLIRPADAGSPASGAGPGRIHIDDQPCDGPVLLAAGQEIALGAVRLRLIMQDIQPPGLFTRLWRRWWFRWSTWALGALAALLVLGYSVLTLIILNEDTLKHQLTAAIAANLLREDAEIGAIQVKTLDGVVTISNVRIKDRDTFASGSPFISIPSATIKIKVWPLLASWFREYRGLEIVLQNPEISLERAKSDGALNIQDILRKYSRRGGPVALGMKELDAVIEVHGGKIRLRDEFTNIGETTLENIELRLRQPAAGQPLTIETCTMLVNATPAPPSKGKLSVSGHLGLLDAGCFLELSALSSHDLRLEMERFDLARIFEHLGYSWAPYGSDFKVMLGKPLTGNVTFDIRDSRHVRVAGSVNSDSLLSIKEDSRPPLGNIPMAFNFDVLLRDNGSGYLPYDMNIRLRSGSDLKNPATTHLNFGAVGRHNPGGASAYTVDLECILQDFLGTDVGRRLGLDGRLGGHLRGNSKLIREANGNWKIDANMELNPGDAFVMVPDPAQPGRYMRQPLPLNFEFHASAQPNPEGGISELAVEKFTLRAPSFSATSEVSGVIKGIGHPGELKAQARFKLNLKGREFWNEFAPILALFGFTQPIEEVFDLTVTLVGEHDIVKVAADGTASRQWDPSPAPAAHDPAPVRLSTVIDFNRAAVVSKSSRPYLALVLEFNSTQGKPMFVHLYARCARDERNEMLMAELGAFDKDNKPTMPGIKSDIATLRERFQPYIEGYLRKLDADARGTGPGWLAKYQKSALQGKLENVGHLTVQRPLDLKSPLPSRVDFDLTASGKELDIQLPLYSGQPLWGWREQSVDMDLKGAYTQRLASTREDPDSEILDVEKLKVVGSVGAFELKLSQLDLFKVLNLRKLPNQTWTDCVAAVSISGQVDPPAFELARSLRALPREYPFCGTLALQAAFDRKKDAFDLQKVSFKQTEKTPISFLLAFDASGSLLRARELSSRLFSSDAPEQVAEQLSGMLDENGPAVLLNHLGDELALNTLQLDSAAFTEWLRRTYDARQGRHPPEFLAGLLRGDWRAENIWKAAGVKFLRTNLGDRTWQLVGAFRNDFTWFGAAPKEGPRTPLFAFGHEWALRSGVSIQNDGCLALRVGEANFDQAQISASIPALKFVYDKPAGKTCKLELAAQYSHGTLAQIGKLKLTGDPLALDITDVEFALGRGWGAFQAAEAIVNGGPLPCAITSTKWDPATDRLQTRLTAPGADLTYLTSLFPRFPAAMKLSGALRDISATYKGSLVSLHAALSSNSAELASRYNLEPTDPRLRGLDPENDSLDLAATANGVKLAINAPERVNLDLSGKVHLNARDLACRDFSASLQCGEAAMEAFAAPVLHVDSTAAKLTLAQACRAPGLPLNVNADLNFSTPFNPATWLAALETIGAAASGETQAKRGGERKLTGLEQLVLSGNLNAPSMRVGELALHPAEARDFTLKALRLNVPAFATELYGGKLEFSNAEFDLSKATAEQKGDALLLGGVAFNVRLKLVDADLGQLMGAAKSGYTVAGKLGAQGNLSGTNLSGLDRHTWEGAVKLRIAPLVCLAPQPSSAPQNGIAPWAAPYTRLGLGFFGAFLRAANKDALNLSELTKTLDLADSTRPMNGIAIALQAYLGRAFGVDFARLDFEPVQPTVTITHGFATLDPLQLNARGVCAGLSLQLKNMKINLADETLADELLVFPVTLPQSARERMFVESWPVGEQQEFLREAEARLPLRLSGRLVAVDAKFPWPQLTNLGRRVVFGVEKVPDLETLERARQHLTRVWSANAALDKAGTLADQTGVGLPGTISARERGETLVDRVPNLPPRLMEKVSVTGAPISPLESLNLILNPVPPPVTPPPTTPPTVPPPQPRN